MSKLHMIAVLIRLHTGTCVQSEIPAKKKKRSRVVLRCVCLLNNIQGLDDTDSLPVPSQFI